MGFEGWNLNDLINYSEYKTYEMRKAVKNYLKAKEERDSVDEEIKKQISS